MKYRFASDSHTHSTCSPDGHSTPAEMLKKADETGLFAYTLSDHCECQKYDERYRESAKIARGQMRDIAENVPHGVKFYMGIELGQPNHNLAAADEIADDATYDFILGSLHNLRNREDFYYFQRAKHGEDIDDEKLTDYILSEYLKELLEVVEWGRFDSLAHITYPLRYLFPAGSRPNYHNQQGQVEQVLAELIKKDKALELNTSRLWRADEVILPDLEIFKLYRSMGGRLVTVGSDAHCTDDLAKGIDMGLDLLKEAGFNEFAVYEKHTPVILPIE